MMEPAGESSLEAAIAWLVQTILATLLMDKMEVWIRQVGLAVDVERLQSGVERVEMVVAAVKGRAAGNRPLSRALAHVKELLYDADDLVDELDYYRLQQQVEGVTRDEPEDTHGVERVDEISTGDAPNTNRSRLRSDTWNHFTIKENVAGRPSKAKCIHCGQLFMCLSDKNGLSSMTKHIKFCKKKQVGSHPPNPSSTGDATGNAMPVEVGSSSNRKRKRTNEEPALQTSVANTHTRWDKAELSNRITKITGQLLSQQDILGALSEVLEPHESSSASNSNNHHLSTASDQHPTSSSLVPKEVYGRVAEKNTIKKLIKENQSGGVNVLPIVGIPGVGKTTLAQYVYNDPDVKIQFHHRIWVCVSHKLDVVKLTKEMLDFFPRERREGSPHKNGRHEGISNFAKLQEILKEYIEYQSNSFLLVLDDVSDNVDYHQWNKFLYPLISSQGNGNLILVTTRSLSIARRIGTLEPIKLGALENDDTWLLLKSCAFGYGDYQGPGNLSTIGRQIAQKLKGNPLAAVTAGALLRDNLNIDHWSNILKKENWKSLGLSGGIMPALKLSYDELPYHLQQCFSYCSIFPDKYRFLGKDLVYIWISQGFVICTDLSKRLEETGWEYLNDLVNLGFFQQVEEQEEEDEDEEEESSPGNQIWYFICDLMHDFAMLVSRTECATIDGLRYNKILPVIRHLSIITNYAYNKDPQRSIHRNEKFEEHLRSTITSVSKLRTLVLLGNYDSFFLQLLQDTFKKAQNLRLLQMSATSADFNSFLCALENPSHIRYLKRESGWPRGALPKVLIKFFHLQVLDVGSLSTIPDGMHKLVSLRHLVSAENCIASVASMTSLQEINDFKVRSCSGGFEISQLQSMNELVQLGVCQLGNVKSRGEAHGAGLRYKEHLEKLHLSWKEYTRDELSTMDVSGPSSEPSVDTAREVLEGLEPHMNLKHLQISGYNGTTSPTWLLSVISLCTLHLVDCGRWRILPSLESLPFLTKLKLRSMREVIEVLVPSLEELVFIEMPKLVSCTSTSVEGLSSTLRVLKIKNCKALKAFNLFEIEQKPWLTGLRKLVLEGCPHLKLLKPLPPSSTCSELLVDGDSVLSSMRLSSSEHLCIGCSYEYRVHDSEDDSDQLIILDEFYLGFHNLGNLKSMEIYAHKNLRSFSFEGFSHLASLKSLKISFCEDLFFSTSDVKPGHTLEDVTAFPCLGRLNIEYCGIAGEWLSLMLQHAPHLEELNLDSIQVPPELNLDSIQVPLSNHISDGEDSSSSRDTNDAWSWSARKQDLYIPLNLATSLKKIIMRSCPRLTFINWSDQGFSGFAFLEKLTIRDCPDLLSPLVHKKDRSDDGAKSNGRWLLPPSLEELDIGEYDSHGTLKPCFPRDSTSLKKLVVWCGHSLETIQLHSCTALENLEIGRCESLTALEGLSFLGRLTHLNVSDCPRLVHQDDQQANGTWLLPISLRQLKIKNSHPQETLQPSFPTDSTSLKTLEVQGSPGLQSIQLHSCTALEELKIRLCGSLTALEGLQCLGSLRHLDVSDCPGLPPCFKSFSRPDYRLCSRLERLEIDDPSVLTTSFCKHLTSLQLLQLTDLKKVTRLTDEQGRALVLLKSLKELQFVGCLNLVDLPAGLRDLPSLQRLKINWCMNISRLPEAGLPLSLEQLEIIHCNIQLAEECMRLPTSKLKVIIN